MRMLAGDELAVSRAGRDLRRLAVVLCLLMAAVVAALGWSSAQSARERQSLQRAEAMARSLAMQISKALALGIPFDRLRGVETAFEHALREMEGVQRIVLVDANERLVRQAGTPANPARSSALVSARAAIRHTDAQGHERIAGAILVEALRADAGRLAFEMSVLLLAVASIAALTVSELWRWKLSRGPGLRVEVIHRARQLMAAGNWTAVADAGPWVRHGWAHACGARVRALSERYQRIRRLTASLASTEPDQTERSRQEKLHEHARGRDQFPAKGPDRMLVSSARHDLRLICFLMLAASEGMRFGAGRIAADAAAWIVVLYAIGALAGQALAARLGRSQSVGQMGSAPALIAQAVALMVSGWLVVALSDVAAAAWIGRCLSAIGVGMVLGVAEAFRAGNTESHGPEPGGIERAITRAGEWAGPLLGFVLIALLGPAAAWLLLAIAVAAALSVCCVLVRQSPWSLDWSGAPKGPSASSDVRWLAVAAAARGALLAWLAARTASGIAQDSLYPAALWLAYGVGICLAPTCLGLVTRSSAQTRCGACASSRTAWISLAIGALIGALLENGTDAA